MEDEKKDFVKSLLFLAKECGKELTKQHFEIYARTMQTVGFEKAGRAVEFHLLNRRDRDPFPTPRELLTSALTVEGEPANSEEIASKMIGAISRFGYVNEEGARAFIGEVGWRVIQNEGGWKQVCSSTKEDQTIFLRSQWRKAVERGLEDRAEEIVRKALDMPMKNKLIGGGNNGDNTGEPTATPDG